MTQSRDSQFDDGIKILVVQTAYLGDIILTTPLLSALKAIFPKSYLALLTTPVGKSALSGLKELDEIIIYDKHNTEKGLGAFWKKVKELRAKHFDLAISPHRSFRTALMLSLSGIPVLVGFRSSALPWIYHFRIARLGSLHQVERNLKLLEPIGELPKDFQPRIKIPIPENFDPSKFGLNAQTPKPWIGFAPGSVWETKRWPIEKFSELGKGLSKKLNATIILIGAESDKELCEQIENRIGDTTGVINLAGKTGLNELFGIISQLGALVANDSAPVHIASGFSIPTVVIFGPTVPEFGFSPWLTPHRIIQKNLPCKPCNRHGPKKCPEKHFKCMLEIEAEEVEKAVEELLNQPA